MNSSEAAASQPTLARRVLLTGAVSSQALGFGRGSGGFEQYATVQWEHFVNSKSGASISYPASWALDADVPTDMIYPHQSFVLRSAPAPPIFTGPDPDLTMYPRDAIFLWLLHYNDRQLGPDAPAFERITSYKRLPICRAGFIEFDRRIRGLSGTHRSFVLRVWVGNLCTRKTRAILNRSLSTLSVP